MFGLEPYLYRRLSEGVLGKVERETSILSVSLREISTSCTYALVIGHSIIYPLSF